MTTVFTENSGSSEYAGIGLGLNDSFKNNVTNHLIHDGRITLADGSQANTKPSDLLRYSLMTWYSKVATTSTLSGLFTTDGRYFDFLIPRGTPDTIKGGLLKMTFANADGVNAAQLPPSEFLFSQYQELTDGVNPSVVFTPEQLWYLNNSWRNMEEQYHYSKLSNTVGNPITATSIANLYSATDTVPVSSTADCYLDLGFSPLMQAKTFLPSISRQPRLRFYPNTNPWINSNVNGDVTLQSTELIMWGNLYSGPVKEKLMILYSSMGTITRTFTIQSWQQTVVCTAAASVGPYVMTSIMGECAALIFFLRSYEATYNSTNLWTEATTGIIDWTVASLRNGTSTPLWYDQIERMILRHHVPMAQNPVLFTGAVPIYAFPHTVNYGRTLREFSHYGSYNYNNTQTLTITPRATATGASGNAILYVWGLRYSGMFQTAGGQLSILRY